MNNNPEHNFKAYSQNYTSMVPGKFAQWLRTCKIYQFIRFIILNIKMIAVVKKSH
ncbi:MAG: hypothetical protein WCR69_03120 [Sulfuricurvum sp.]